MFTTLWNWVQRSGSFNRRLISIERREVIEHKKQRRPDRRAAAIKADALLPNREDVWQEANCLVHLMAVRYVTTPSFASPIQGMQRLQLPRGCEISAVPVGAIEPLKTLGLAQPRAIERRKFTRLPSASPIWGRN
jgi:hypothetical protein